MNVTSEEDITGAVALALRERAKLPQHKFWRAIGVNQSSGCRYEKGNFQRDQIPHPIRILLYLAYVAGVPIDVTSRAWPGEVTKVAQGTHAVCCGATNGQNSATPV